MRREEFSSELFYRWSLGSRLLVVPRVILQVFGIFELYLKPRKKDGLSFPHSSMGYKAMLQGINSARRNRKLRCLRTKFPMFLYIHSFLLIFEFFRSTGPFCFHLFPLFSLSLAILLLKLEEEELSQHMLGVSSGCHAEAPSLSPGSFELQTETSPL